MIGAKRIGYMTGGTLSSYREKQRVCATCQKRFLGGHTAKYCLDHKPIGGMKKWLKRENKNV